MMLSPPESINLNQRQCCPPACPTDRAYRGVSGPRPATKAYWFHTPEPL